MEKNWFFHFVEFLDIPFYWLRKLTIPPCNDEEYKHLYLVLWPILGVAFLIFNLTTNNWFYLYALPVSVLLMFIFFKFPSLNEKTKVPAYFLIVVIFGVVNGIFWTKLCCALLVDLLTFIGKLTGLSSTYLGLTVIAVGNALGDGLTTIAIAKKGQAVLGLTGGIVGQLFGLLIGFGVSMLKKSLTEGEQVFDLFNLEKLNENLLDLIVIGVSLFNLIFMIIYLTFNKFHLDRKLAYILLAIYTGFILTTSIIAFKQAFFDA